MTDNTQPLALILADRLHHEQPTVLRIDAEHAGEELRRQHARIAELEAQLSAIGAGGVSGPLMGRAPEGITRDDTVHGETYFTAADMATASAQGFRDGVASIAASAGSEPVAWYVTGCGRLLDEDEAKAEARHIGGSARAIPLYTAPQADSVTAPAAGAVAHTISDAQIEAMPVWRNFVGLWPESRREIVDAVVDLLAAAPTPPAQAADSVTAPAGGVADDLDAIALARYKVVPAHESMFHRFAVVAGDGKQQLYLGREVECENMARKFAGAFLDGAFYQSNIAPTPPAQAADSVLEDAARLDWLDKNIFYREMDNWDAKYGHGDSYNMWVLFSPKGAQGSARNIIDAARAAQKGGE